MESKIQITDRLRDMNLWDQASRERDELRKELRDQGMTRRDANERSWELIAERYPADDPSTHDYTLSSEIDSSMEIPENSRPDLIRDILWVYEHLGMKDNNIDSAPSHGALGLLQWARSSPSRFFEKMLYKAIDAKHQDSVRQNDRKNQIAMDLEDAERILSGL